jgi:hypothetical protein
VPRGRSLAITLLMLAVIAAAGVAFVLTQGEKQAKPAVRLVELPEIVSPGCRCPYETAKLKISLEKPATLGVQVVSAAGEQSVATLDPGSAFPAGRTPFTWDGLDSSGEPAMPGEYRIRMDLPRQDRTYTPAKAIKVVPPRRAPQLQEQAEPAPERQGAPPDSR